jgi:hypothetical protein
MEFNKLSKNNGRLPLVNAAEEVGLIQTRAQVIPGRFYKLTARVDVPQITSEWVYQKTGKNWIDLDPVGLLLFHDNWKEVALVLNLKVIPPQVQAKVLEAYWNFSKLNGLANLFNQDNQLRPLEERRLIDQRFYLITPTALSTILGVNNLNYAISTYRMDQVISARLIDWDNFGSLVNPAISDYGFYPKPANLAQIYENFLTNTLI